MEIKIAFNWTIPIEQYGNIKPGYEISLTDKDIKNKNVLAKNFLKIRKEIMEQSDILLSEVVKHHHKKYKAIVKKLS